MTDDSAPRFDPRFNPEFQPGYTPADAGAGAAPQPPAPIAQPSRGASAPGTDAPTGTGWRSSRRAAETGRPAATAPAAPTVVSTAPLAPPVTSEPSSAAPVASVPPSSVPVASVPVASVPPSSVPASSVPPSSVPPSSAHATSAVVSSPAFESSEGSDSDWAAEDAAPSVGQQLRNPFLLGLLVVAAALIIVGSWMFAQAYAAFSDTGNFASPADFVALESAMRVAPIVILGGVGVAVAVLLIFARSWRPRK